MPIPYMLSLYVSRMGLAPAYAINPDVTHLAASTMKVAVLDALYRSRMALDTSVPVHNSFASVLLGLRFSNDPKYDSDPEPWQRIGGTATLRWLAGRMITHSSNLATNLCLEAVGLSAVREVWRLAGAEHSVTDRGIEDYAADAAGIRNLTTAADLARLLCRLPPELIDVLAANVYRVDLAAGLPPETRIAFKNGWFPGLRHSAGIVYPDDAPPYVLAICYSGTLANGHASDDLAARLLARVSAWFWAARQRLGAPLVETPEFGLGDRD